MRLSTSSSPNCGRNIPDWLAAVGGHCCGQAIIIIVIILHSIGIRLFHLFVSEFKYWIPVRLWNANRRLCRTYPMDDPLHFTLLHFTSVIGHSRASYGKHQPPLLLRHQAQSQSSGSQSKRNSLGHISKCLWMQIHALLLFTHRVLHMAREMMTGKEGAGRPKEQCCYRYTLSNCWQIRTSIRF